MTAARCDQCGAPLELEGAGRTVRCEYCQHTHVVAALGIAVEAPTAAPALTYSPGQAVFCEWGGRWWRARVLEVTKVGYVVHYDGYSSSWDEPVGADRLRPAGASPPATAARSGLSRARLLAAGVALLVVLFLVPAAMWSLTRGASPTGSRALPAGAQPGRGQLEAGQPVSVYWGSRWYDATVLSTYPDGRVRIHYDGWADSWDEDVTLDRVRLR